MHEAVLTAWAELLDREQVGPRGGRDAALAELGPWLELIDSAVAGDEPAKKELDKLVAFQARSLGIEDRPASSAVLRVHLLGEALAQVNGKLSPPLRAHLRWLMRIAADAHALGAAERSENRHHREIRDFSPVFRLRGDTVVAMMLGPMTPEIIDAITGRLLRECAASGAKVAVLDCFGAAEDDDRFHRTIAAMLAASSARDLELVLTGLRDPERTRRALQAIDAKLERLRLVPSLGAYLEAGSGVDTSTGPR
jgi:hypothetical protein